MTIWAVIMLALVIAAVGVHWTRLVVFLPESVLNLFTGAVMAYVLGIGLALLRLLADAQSYMLSTSVPDYGNRDSIGIFQQQATSGPLLDWWVSLPQVVFNAPFYLSAILFLTMLIVGGRWLVRRPEPMKVSRKRARDLASW